MAALRVYVFFLPNYKKTEVGGLGGGGLMIVPSMRLLTYSHSEDSSSKISGSPGPVFHNSWLHDSDRDDIFQARSRLRFAAKIESISTKI